MIKNNDVSRGFVMRRFNVQAIFLFYFFVLLSWETVAAAGNKQSKLVFFDEPEENEHLPLGHYVGLAPLETATLVDMGVEVQVVNSKTQPKKQLSLMEKRVLNLIKRVKLSSTELANWLVSREKPVVLGITNSHKSFFLKNTGVSAVALPLSHASVILVQPYYKLLLTCGERVYASALKKLIKNELFHLYIFEKNRESESIVDEVIRGDNSAYPFLNRQGQIDAVKLNLFSQSLRDFIVRMYHLKKLFLNKQFDHPFIEKVTAALIGYSQNHEVYRMSIKKFKKLKLESLDGGRRFFSPNVPYHFKKPHGLQTFLQHHELMKRKPYRQYQQLCLRRMFGHGVVASLMSDFAEIQLVMLSEQYYQSKQYYLWLTELGSFVAAFPSAVIALLAPEFCEYMAKYLGVKHFCNEKQANELLLNQEERDIENGMRSFL